MLFVQKPTEYEIILRNGYAQTLKTKKQFIDKEKILALKKKSKYLKNKFKKLESHYTHKLTQNKSYKIVQI